MRFLTKAKILGTGYTIPSTRSKGVNGEINVTASMLMQKALNLALDKAKVSSNQLDGLIAVPSLSEPRFMEAHYLATKMNLLPSKRTSGFIARTLDTGGAGPISALIEADRMIRTQGCDLVAIVAGDAVSSLDTDEFLRRADAGCQDPDGHLTSPVIPRGYDQIAQWQIQTTKLKREELAMVSEKKFYSLSSFSK